MRNFFKKYTVVELAVYSALAFIFLSCNPSWANQIKNGSTAVVSFLARNASNLSQYITGLTTGTTNITVYRKNLSALSMTTNTLSEVANGLYRITLNATHTNTTGELVYRINWSSGDYWGRDEVVDNLTSDVYAKADAANTSASAANASASAANATVNHATYGNSPIYNLVGTRGTSNLTPSDNIGINWGDITNPTTSVGLSGTTISTSQQVASVSGAVGSVTGAVGSISGVTWPENFASLSIDVNGKVLLQAVQTGVTIPTVTSLTNAPGDSSGVTDLLSRLSATRAGYLDYINTIYGKLPTNYIMGSSVLTAKDDEIDAIKTQTDKLTFTGSYLQADVVDWKGSTAPAMTGDAYARLGAPAGASVSADIAAIKSDSAAILTDTSAVDTSAKMRTFLTGSDTALSTLTSADVTAAVWDISLPGAYAVGKAGYILGTYLDVAMSSRLASASYTAPDNAGIAAIQAKTDNLPSDPADESALEALIGDLPNNTELAAAFTEIKGATWSSTTDTLEAIRDRGDAAWLTAAGFAEPGDAMTLTAAYDAAKTAAQAGDTMKVSSGTGAGQVNLVSGAVALQADQAVNVTKIEGSDATDQLDAHDGNPPAASDIKTALEADGSKLDHLWETTEDDGGVRRFTANALEQAPTGGSAPTAVQIREEIDSNSTQLAAIATATGTTIPGLINDLNDLALQDVRDAMKLAPSAGDPAAGSIDEKLNTAQADLDNPDQYKAAVSGLATSAEITALNDVSVSDITGALLLNPTYKIATDSSGRVSVYDLAAAALAKMFTQDTGTTYSGAVAGSVVKEIADNTAAGSGDWTSSEKTEIKTILGVTGTGTPTSTPSTGALKKIYTEMAKDYNIGP